MKKEREKTTLGKTLFFVLRMGKEEDGGAGLIWAHLKHTRLLPPYYLQSDPLSFRLWHDPDVLCLGWTPIPSPSFFFNTHQLKKTCSMYNK